MNDRLMSVHNKVPELNDSDWSKQSKKELCEALIDGMITEEDFTNEVDNLDKPISGNGKTTNTKCVAQMETTWSLILSLMGTACMEQ